MGGYDPEVFAQIVGGRTDEVPDVFDDKQADAGQVQLLDGIRDHFGFKMADRAGRDLNRLRARFAEAPRVVVRGQVADDDAGFQSGAQSPDGFLKERGFARAGR